MFAETKDYRKKRKIKKKIWRPGKFLMEQNIKGVEEIWRGSIFVSCYLGTRSHRFQGLDGMMLAPKELSVSLAKKVTLILQEMTLLT